MFYFLQFHTIIDQVSYQPPFRLSKDRAREEAEILVHNEEVWVHTARNHAQEEEIASIVACTRNSATVGTITKVFTNPRWRRRGCAERLVRRVCTQYALLSWYTDIL